MCLQLPSIESLIRGLFLEKRYSRLQNLTVEEFLNGKQLEYPRLAPEVTFKKAERKSKGREPEQGRLI